MQFAARRATNDGVSRAGILHIWPFRFSLFCPELSGSAGAPALAAVLAITLCGCSFDLGSVSSAPDKEAAPKPAPAGASVAEAQAATTRGQTLAQTV
jgi:hypothetical protein